MDVHSRQHNLSRQIAVELDVASCAISLAGRPVEASDLAAGDLEDWQVVLGYGPSRRAFRSGRTVEQRACDARSTDVDEFAQYMAATGVASATALPLCASGEPLGAMTIYQRSPRSLTTRERLQAKRAAERVAASIRLDPLEWVMRRDMVTAGLELAAGCVMARSTLSAADATVLIRAHAYATGTTLRETCAQVIEGSAISLV